MGGEEVGGGGGSCKYDEWGYFQSEGVNVTVYPSLCHYNGTLYNGNWELGANIGAIILRRKNWLQLLLRYEMCADADTEAGQ